jgi:transposase InsO family protein
MKDEHVYRRARSLYISSKVKVAVAVAPVAPLRSSNREAKVVIENWRREYNTIRPHSILNYGPPAPEAILPLGFQQP